jgi:WD40 repeat protein
VRLWDVATGREQYGEDQELISQVGILQYAPDGKTLVSAGLKYMPDGRALVSAGEGATFVWDAATGKRRAIVRTNVPDASTPEWWAGKGARLLAISPDSKQLAWVGSSLHVWDLVASRETMVFPVPRGTNSLFFSPEGQKLFTLDCSLPGRPPTPTTHTVRLWDLATGKQERLWTVAPQHDQWGLLARDGKSVLANAVGRGIKIYDIESEHQRLLPGAGEAFGWYPFNGQFCLVPSCDVKVLASGRPGPVIRLWELTTGKEIFALEGHEQPVYSMAWSPNGRLLASGSYQPGALSDVPVRTSIRLWDTATGKELAHWGGKGGHGTVAFSPDGMKLAAALSDIADEYTIMILDITKFDPALKPAPKISEKELESRWTELADDSAGKAHAALWALVASPTESVSVLRKRLKPAVAVDPGQIRRWVADLDDNKFAVREAAANDLKKTDRQVEPFFQEAVKNNPSLEARRRLEQILNSVRDAPGREVLRTIRAIMALERIGTPPARALLESLAQGAAGARETGEAKASLERLRLRTSSVP